MSTYFIYAMLILIMCVLIQISYTLKSVLNELKSVRGLMIQNRNASSLFSSATAAAAEENKLRGLHPELWRWEPGESSSSREEE